MREDGYGVGITDEDAEALNPDAKRWLAGFEAGLTASHVGCRHIQEQVEAAKRVSDERLSLALSVLAQWWGQPITDVSADRHWRTQAHEMFADFKKALLAPGESEEAL